MKTYEIYGGGVSSGTTNTVFSSFTNIGKSKTI
jgi:hypothetical protein